MVITVLAAILLSAIAWRHREYQYARTLMVLLSAVTWWSLTYIVGLGTTVPGQKRFVYGLSYPAIGLVSIAWFVFAIQYTGKLRVPTKQEFAGLGIVPVVTTVAALTNQHHGLVWSSVDIVSQGQLELMSTSPGPLFWVHTIQSYALIGLGTGYIVATAILSDRDYGSTAATLTLAATFPLGINILYLTGVVGPVDLTPSAFALSGTVLIAGAFRDQLLRSLPLARGIARDKIIKKMSSPVIVVDKQARIVDINPAATSLADMTTDCAGSHVGTVFPEIADFVDLNAESRQQTNIVITDDEVKQHFEVETLPLRRGGGTVRGQLVRMNDVTELKSRQRELFEERQFIDQALDALDDLFYVLDADGNFRRWNRQLLDVTGYTEPALEEMHASDLFTRESQSVVHDAIETTIQSGGITVEADLLTADGERIPHEFTGARLEDEDGQPTGLVGIGRDISDRNKRERRLRTFREAVENAGRMVYWMDSDGTVEYANPAFETQIQYDAAELVGEQTYPLVGIACSDALADHMVNTLSQGETWQAEFGIRRGDGERRTVDQTVQPVYDDGELVRLVAVAGDISEKKTRKQQLSVLRRILRHDLRNNMNEILLSVQLAKREATSDTVTQRLTGAEQTITETMSLSQDVKQFRQAFETGTIEDKIVDAAAATREQLSVARTERTDVEFSVDLPETAPVVTNDLFERAVRNVLRNAVEHNDASQPEVTVTLERRAESDEFELMVADNGPGVPEAIIEVLNSKREDQLDHLDGFGLWLTNWVIDLSGGRLKFAENSPRGTAITLVFPAAHPIDHTSPSH